MIKDSLMPSNPESRPPRKAGRRDQGPSAWAKVVGAHARTPLATPGVTWFLNAHMKRRRKAG